MARPPDIVLDKTASGLRVCATQDFDSGAVTIHISSRLDGPAPGVDQLPHEPASALMLALTASRLDAKTVTASDPQNGSITHHITIPCPDDLSHQEHREAVHDNILWHMDAHDMARAHSAAFEQQSDWLSAVRPDRSKLEGQIDYVLAAPNREEMRDRLKDLLVQHAKSRYKPGRN